MGDDLPPPPHMKAQEFDPTDKRIKVKKEKAGIVLQILMIGSFIFSFYISYQICVFAASSK